MFILSHHISILLFQLPVLLRQLANAKRRCGLCEDSPTFHPFVSARSRGNNQDVTNLETFCLIILVDLLKLKVSSLLFG